MMKKTFVTVMMDSSVSMQSMREQVISGFNEQLESLKNLAGKDHEVLVTLVTFSTPGSTEVVRNKEKVSKIKPLTLDEYNPVGGSTALLDAMHFTTILASADMKEVKEGKNAGLVLFVTDGGENSSQLVKNTGTIKDHIQKLTNTERFTFTYMGVGDLKDISNSFGIAVGNTVQFNNDYSKNIAASGSGLTSYMTSRSMGETQVKNFYDPATLNKSVVEQLQQITGGSK